MSDLNIFEIFKAHVWFCHLRSCFKSMTNFQINNRFQGNPRRAPSNLTQLRQNLAHGGTVSATTCTHPTQLSGQTDENASAQSVSSIADLRDFKRMGSNCGAQALHASSAAGRIRALCQLLLEFSTAKTVAQESTQLGVIHLARRANIKIYETQHPCAYPNANIDHQRRVEPKCQCFETSYQFPRGLVPRQLETLLRCLLSNELVAAKRRNLL